MNIAENFIAIFNHKVHYKVLYVFLGRFLTECVTLCIRKGFSLSFSYFDFNDKFLSIAMSEKESAFHGVDGTPVPYALI